MKGWSVRRWHKNCLKIPQIWTNARSLSIVGRPTKKPHDQTAVVQDWGKAILKKLSWELRQSGSYTWVSRRLSGRCNTKDPSKIISCQGSKNTFAHGLITHLKLEKMKTWIQRYSKTFESLWELLNLLLEVGRYQTSILRKFIAVLLCNSTSFESDMW